MKRVVCVCFFILSGLSFCFAKSTETYNITTYYPSPQGVYSTLRLYPSNQSSAYTSNGTLYYNITDNKLYIYGDNYNWTPIGGGAKIKVQTGSEVYPDKCAGTKKIIVAPPEGDAPWDTSDYELCNATWHKNITFDTPFTSQPDVFVSAQYFAGNWGHELENYTCGRHTSDRLIAYAGCVTNTGFTLFAGGSAPSGYDCEAFESNKTLVSQWFLRVTSRWMAIGQ